ncbi:methylated-DNA--[protein]-cysteine S-methyltransferase [Salinicola corii]|uniref:methylated-DNA--[protein]-cysteine S-methyltransferase n=1 Tax=Salinicola corii TaxID=2606937 RepID=A0A640WD01_9GAMM|nr:methylated-DNA--[protein]-cysteine S-methyltransferase [Salinicola corii]KAA0016142.1 methylated-DNA--[protein]-cysteine S-methyltransferase [Salinicola corii]
MRYVQFLTDHGEMMLVGDEQGLRELRLPRSSRSGAPASTWQEDAGFFAQARAELEAYLAGRRRSFNVTLAPEGSDFQLQVWQGLLRIPYGKTSTYGEMAHRLGKDGAAQAIGGAVGANPLPLFIPCHRVVAARGMGGYSGGETLKRALLTLEGGWSGS